MLVRQGKLPSSAAEAASRYADLCRGISSLDPGFISNAICGHLQGASERNLAEKVSDFIGTIGDVDQDEAINDFCDWVLPESALPPDDPRAIQFLTIHGSKGLTRRVVVMPGLEDAWLPGPAKGADLAERARLFYIGLTRATDVVCITYPKSRARGDRLNFPVPGRRKVCRFVAASGIAEIYHA